MEGGKQSSEEDALVFIFKEIEGSINDCLVNVQIGARFMVDLVESKQEEVGLSK